MAGLYQITCDCCGRTCIEAGDVVLFTRCFTCRNRGGLCMHNVFNGRYLGLEPGSFTVRMHSSRPHPDDQFADTPETCSYCRPK